jgi:hypothetical protein
MTVDQLMDVLEDPVSSPADRSSARTEIRKRAETPLVAVPDITTPDAILARAVDQLRTAGRYDIAHACLVVFAGAMPDPALIRCASLNTAQPGHPHRSLRQELAGGGSAEVAVDEAASTGLVAWVVGCARARAEALWGGIVLKHCGVESC